MYKIRSIFVLVLFAFYWFSLPSKLFNTPYSTVIESNDFQLLGAKIARDGQWRFPLSDSIPYKFEKCIIEFEDAHFYKHPGFNPISIYKAFKTNLKQQKIVRGGSTITQQVIRLSRQNKSRTYLEKIIELILSTRLEIKYSKKEILKLYVSQAPFGGNTVGLEAAAWRYFGTSPNLLSWAETATLAVLPNAPGLIFPGTNDFKLLKKRNFLLKKLYSNKIITKDIYEMSLLESLPDKPHSIPQIAPHLLQEISKKNNEKKTITTIDYFKQKQINKIVDNHYNTLKQNEIHNIAVLVLNVKTKKVEAYIGNTNTTNDNHKYVNVIEAPRSTGSTLKPLLYASALDAGELLPNSLLPDVPYNVGDYKPENYNLSYKGAVKANNALSESLNIPMVYLLKKYGLQPFYDKLESCNFKFIDKGADHYGLPLVLGGAESSLFDLCNTYCNMAGTLLHYNRSSGEYYKNEFQKASFYNDFKLDLGELNQNPNHFTASAIHFTFKAMQNVNRPEIDQAWRYYNSSQKIAWKTGTSFGNKDALAIGVTPKYVVGVWVGNADSEGRPELTGVKSAAPIMFDIFDILPKSNGFKIPYDELYEANICKQSGMLANEWCNKEKKLIQNTGINTKQCKYHHLVHLNKAETKRVNSACEKVSNIVNKPWFSLPPLMAFYYKQNNTNYIPLPPLDINCSSKNIKSMDFISPKNNTIILPKNVEGRTTNLALKIAHNKSKITLYWYINNKYITSTEDFHEIEVPINKGTYVITVLDSEGNEIKKTVTIKT